MRSASSLRVIVIAALIARSQLASANECNLNQPQSFGVVREGCSVTIFALPDVDPPLLEITRNRQLVTPTIAQDEVTLKVAFEHYASPESCDLGPPEYENMTFDRYVMSWPDLKGGDEIRINDRPYTTTVPGPGDCGTVEPSFSCADGVHFCGTGSNDLPNESDDDQGGCAAAGGSLGWLALLALAGLVRRGRRSS